MTKDVLTHGVSTLAEICLQSSLKFLESSKVRTQNTFLPEDICEALICKKLKTGHCDDDFIATYFSDIQTSRITKIHVSGAAVTDSALEVLSVHPLREVDVSNCEVSEKSIKSLIKCKNTLTSLNLSRCRGITAFNELQHLTSLKSLNLSDTFLEQRHFECLSALSHLRSLNVSETEITSLEPVKTMTLLTNLDLSKCVKVESIEPLETIKGTLQWLSLYNCRKLFLSYEKQLIETLEKLSQLQHLDLSKDDPEEQIGMHSFLERLQILVDDSFLERLLPSLQNLTWLDLSGNTKFTFGDLQLFKKCYPQKLEFLGLFNTDMCTYPEIPAVEVSGNGNAKQVMLSVKIYNDRPTFLTSAMRELFSIIRNEAGAGFDKSVICNIVLGAMESHPKDKHIQLAGSASLYHLSRDDDDDIPVLSAELKRRIIEVTLSAMEYHVSEAQLQRNCCLTLCNFRIPREITCDYRRMVEVLLRTAMVHKNDFIQRIAISLCNMLVCQVQDSQKLIVGRDLEGVEKILQIMRYKMGSSPDHGGVLECCWSALWNVTDETPENCELFITHGGIELFMECKKKLGDQRDLVRNMLGLMGNVAEVAELRSKLMAIAHIFYDLLQTEDQLEVTYNAAGIISHLAFDGPDKWTNRHVSRDQALKRLEEAVGKWNIDTSRQMSYRSFAPILRLISNCDTSAIHYWATWALANLCNVDAAKYCKLLIEEGGVKLLEELFYNPLTSQRVSELVHMTLVNCRLHLPEDDN